MEGVGLSEGMRGTRGGIADHMGMVAGRAGEFVCVSDIPPRELGRATIPTGYVAVAFDSGVVCVYDEPVKEETVMGIRWPYS